MNEYETLNFLGSLCVLGAGLAFAFANAGTCIGFAIAGAMIGTGNLIMMWEKDDYRL